MSSSQESQPAGWLGRVLLVLGGIVLLGGAALSWWPAEQWVAWLLPGRHLGADTTHLLTQLPLPTLGMGLGLLGLGWWLYRRPTGLAPAALPIAAEWDVLLISAVTLFFELLMIRWLSSELRLLAYFKNLTLICSFLGLGIGLGMARSQRDRLPWVLVACVMLVLLGISPHGRLLGGAPIPGGETEHLWTLRSSPSLIASILFYALMTGVIFLQAALFIPFGQRLGRGLRALAPLTGYSLNIAGSLAGIWLFAAVSAWGWPSVAWFAVGLAGWGALVWPYRTLRLFHGLGALLVCGLVAVGDRGSLWSPYYKMTVSPITVTSAAGTEPWGYHLAINHTAFIDAVDFSPAFVARHQDAFPRWQRLALAEDTRFDVPFQLVPAENALIIGSGLGMDVAGARRHGIQQIDAVDIDPMMFVLGRRLHPEQPYDAPGVRRITNDARAFFHQANAEGRRYDLVYFASLDSRTLLAGMASVRLDNYLYTRESFQEAKRLLSDDGILALYFWSARPWISERLGRLMQETFPDAPLLTDGAHFFITGPGLRDVYRKLLRDPDLQATSITFAPTSREGRLIPTDQWPYLYLARPTIPLPNVGVLAVLVMVAFWLIRRAHGHGLRIDGHFFFLGAAFLLMETAGVTRLALLFGSTWWINTLVFSAVMLMILAANAVVRWCSPLPAALIWFGLTGSLVAQVLIPMGVLLEWPAWARLLGAGAIFGLPFFFAALWFARSFHGVAKPSEALASNLLGSVVGGCLEYLSLCWGLPSLSVLAWVLYAAALVCANRALRAG